MVGIVQQRAVGMFLLICCGATLSSVALCAEVENLAQIAVSSIVAQKYTAAVNQFHYAATVPEQSRVDDRRHVMTPILSAVFKDWGELSRAHRGADLDTSDLLKTSLVLGIFAGDLSDWRSESARFPTTQVCYRVIRKGVKSFVIDFRYIRPKDQWELLDILVLAPPQDANAVAQLAELGKRVFNVLRAVTTTRPT
jgi:hypothetical protein